MQEKGAFLPYFHPQPYAGHPEEDIPPASIHKHCSACGQSCPCTRACTVSILSFLPLHAAPNKQNTNGSLPGSAQTAEPVFDSGKKAPLISHMQAYNLPEENWQTSNLSFVVVGASGQTLSSRSLPKSLPYLKFLEIFPDKKA